MVVGSVLTAALALVALPGLVGSRAPSPLEPVPPSAFQSIQVPANAPRSIAIGGLDPAYASAGAIDGNAPFIEPATAPDAGVTARGIVNQPHAAGTSVRRTPRYTLSGYATFYDNGTTAMRLPRGTVVVICGGGGCVERVVNDYGPIKKTRVVDMYRPDFFRICGCGWYAGTTKVTVYVY
jgi:hypothetical protein